MNDFFKQNKGNFDIYEPPTGHQERFLEKLKVHSKPKKTLPLIQKILIAASIVLLAGLSISTVIYKQKQPVNSELLQNERYFSMLIQEEIESIKNEETQETEKIFKDALQQIKILEKDYQKLLKDYNRNKDKFIINAMIENFQKRIEILQYVKQQIQNIKRLKTSTDEKNRV